MNLFDKKIPYSENGIEYFFENSEFSKKNKYYFIEDSAYFYSDFGLFIQNCSENLSHAMYFTISDLKHNYNYQRGIYTYEMDIRNFYMDYIHLFVRERESELYKRTSVEPIHIKHTLYFSTFRPLLNPNSVNVVLVDFINLLTFISEGDTNNLFPL